MRFVRTILPIFFCLSFASACKKKAESDASSDEPSKSADGTPHNMLIYMSVSDLPKCSLEGEGATVFVTETRMIYVCQKGEWNEVELEAKKQVVVEQNYAEAWRSIIEKQVKSVGYIEAKYKSPTCERYESGTAFMVGKDLIATNGHAVTAKMKAENCNGDLLLKSVRVWFVEDAKGNSRHNERGDDGCAMEIDRSIEKTDDIVLLKMRPGTTGARAMLTLSETDEAQADGRGVKILDQVLQLGFSGATTFVHFATGSINQIQKTQASAGSGYLSNLVAEKIIAPGKLVYEYDLVSGKGASGGPVLDLNGKAFGINFAGNTKDSDTEFGYAVQIKHLRDLLAATRKFEPLSAGSEECK